VTSPSAAHHNLFIYGATLAHDGALTVGARSDAERSTPCADAAVALAMSANARRSFFIAVPLQKSLMVRLERPDKLGVPGKRDSRSSDLNASS
jgi:hypothetical protein